MRLHMYAVYGNETYSLRVPAEVKVQLDNVSLEMKVNGERALRIDSGNRVVTRAWRTIIGLWLCCCVRGVCNLLSGIGSLALLRPSRV